MITQGGVELDSTAWGQGYYRVGWVSLLLYTRKMSHKWWPLATTFLMFNIRGFHFVCPWCILAPVDIIMVPTAPFSIISQKTVIKLVPLKDKIK